MKRSLWISAFLMMGVTLGAAITHVTAQPKDPPPPARVAVVDIGQLFRNYRKAIDYANMQRVEGQRLQAEDDAKEAALQKESNILNELRPGTGDYEKQVEKIERMDLDRRGWQTMESNRHQRLVLQRTTEMYNEIVRVSGDVARKAGYNLVMTKEPPDAAVMRSMDELLRTKVLYAADTLDITTDVLTQLNEQYTATKK